MTDLPQRLRLNATIPLVMEAADRIEALEAALREIRQVLTAPKTNERGLAEAFDITTRLLHPTRAALAPEQDK